MYYYSGSPCRQLWIKSRISGLSVQGKRGGALMPWWPISPLLRSVLRVLNGPHFHDSCAWNYMGGFREKLEVEKIDSPGTMDTRSRMFSANRNEPSTVAMAEIRGQLRDCDMGHQRCLWQVFGDLGSDLIYLPYMWPWEMILSLQFICKMEQILCPSIKWGNVIVWKG